MKIGILTLHSQINYGGVLQAYALQKYLRSNGYDVEVIDYWLTPANGHLYGFWLSESKTFLARVVRFPYWCIRDGFVWAEIRRRRRTMRFLRERLKLSSQAYKILDDLKKVSGYDIVIVGSDQIWHPVNISVPNPFLLDWLKPKGGVPQKIAYAASFGVNEIPSDRTLEYCEGLKSFTAIGVREEEGRRLVQQLSGRDAARVVDPSLLLSKNEWLVLARGKTRIREGQYIFCYWLGDLGKVMPVLKSLIQAGKNVIFLTEWGGGRSRFRANFKLRLFLLTHSRIRCCFDSGPEEFLGFIAHADAVLSDSFHAMMFSSIFDKPMCIVHKSSKKRESMGARLWDFQTDCQCTGLVREFSPTSVDDLHFSRLPAHSVQLALAVTASKTWLFSAITK